MANTSQILPRAVAGKCSDAGLSPKESYLRDVVRAQVSRVAVHITGGTDPYTVREPELVRFMASISQAIKIRCLAPSRARVTKRLREQADQKAKVGQTMARGGHGATKKSQEHGLGHARSPAL